MDFGLLLILIISCVAVLVVILSLYAMKAGRKREEKPLDMPEVRERLPTKVERSVASDDAKKARDELRMLDIEREILSYAIRRLYEAQAEGKISEEERERLALAYKEKMLKIKEAISRSESIVALHELETMEEDLVKLFSERFDEINRKIGDLRASLELKPIREVPVPASSPALPPAPLGREKRGVRKPSAPKKTEAEKRIEEIKAEVEKVLERLGQIEVEA
ncbi:MAG: hypothetical protein AOA66_0524 [Candidatus Bathyarchaeota archaeon BA2]|nr:MAG: hypothetical protein AOA66_0524 [Candidatus Bathyarchaeota archaeon BA2]